MDSSITNHQKNVATLIQLSVFSKYFIPFGNFIAPIVLWTLNKGKSIFIDYNGKQAINFQLSMVLYNIVMVLIGIATFIVRLGYTWSEFNFFTNDHFYFLNNMNILKDNLILIMVYAMVLAALFILELYCTIMAAITAKNGQYYKFPITINFIK